jgi:nitrogen fixation NifU-like protein
MYSAQLLDRFQNPRNAGDLAGAEAIAELENPVCGDIIRLSLKLHAGRIAEARFKAKGCVPAMACGSALSELLIGKTPDDARGLRREDVIHAVGGVPHSSTHAAQLAIDVLNAALSQLSSRPASIS